MSKHDTVPGLPPALGAAGAAGDANTVVGADVTPDTSPEDPTVAELVAKLRSEAARLLPDDTTVPGAPGSPRGVTTSESALEQFSGRAPQYAREQAESAGRGAARYAGMNAPAKSLARLDVTVPDAVIVAATLSPGLSRQVITEPFGPAFAVPSSASPASDVPLAAPAAERSAPALPATSSAAMRAAVVAPTPGNAFGPTSRAGGAAGTPGHAFGPSSGAGPTPGGAFAIANASAPVAPRAAMRTTIPGVRQTQSRTLRTVALVLAVVFGGALLVVGWTTWGTRLRGTSPVVATSSLGASQVLVPSLTGASTEALAPPAPGAVGSVASSPGSVASSSPARSLATAPASLARPSAPTVPRPEVRPSAELPPKPAPSHVAPQDPKGPEPIHDTARGI